MRAVLLLALCVGFDAPAAAQTPQARDSAPVGLTEWTPGKIVPGSAAMRLVGDPANAEIFVVRFKYPS